MTTLPVLCLIGTSNLTLTLRLVADRMEAGVDTRTNPTSRVALHERFTKASEACLRREHVWSATLSASISARSPWPGQSCTAASGGRSASAPHSGHCPEWSSSVVAPTRGPVCRFVATIAFEGSTGRSTMWHYFEIGRGVSVFGEDCWALGTIVLTRTVKIHPTA